VAKRKKSTHSLTQKLLWALSIVMVLSMVVSLFVIAIPGPVESTPTAIPWPTFRPQPTSTTVPTSFLVPTATSTAVLEGPTEAGGPAPTQPPAGTPSGSATPLTPPAATEAPLGPELPSATPAVTYTLPTEPTATPSPSSAGLPLQFAVMGDSRDNRLVFGEVLIRMTTDGSQFVVHTGDMVNSGTEDQWRLFAEDMQGYPLPFYPVPGNHDGLSGTLDGFLAYSGAPARHYSFDRGTTHFTLADSHNGGVGADEVRWIRQDIVASQAALKVVVLHHPPFDPDGTDHIMAYGNQAFMDLMDELDVDYVFAGHIHAYAQQERSGTVYVYTGGAGAPLYTEGHPQAFHHYLRVRVLGDQVSVEVVRL